MLDKLKIAVKAAIDAGKAINEIYELPDFEIESKQDNSPLTLADRKANDVINSFLLPTKIPVISEENKQLPYSIRRNWDQCWIVDPLDGTKEFIKRNGEFTVNIAFVENGKPELGVIYVPALNILYYAVVSQGKAKKVEVYDNETVESLFSRAKNISPAPINSVTRVVGSRSHMNDETLNFINALEEEKKEEVEIVSRGSSLKFCMVAEGAAHIYPRFAPTMEWDTAAGQAICEAVGLKVRLRDTGESLSYNRENLLNDHFIVSNAL